MKLFLLSLVSICVGASTYCPLSQAQSQELIYGSPSDSLWSEEAEDRINNLSGLRPRQRIFLMEELLPIVGRRLFSDGTHFRPIEVKDNSVQINFSDGDLIIEWIESENTITFRVGDNENVVIQKPGQKINTRAVIQKALVGHSLHPYIVTNKSKEERSALGEALIFLRPGQKDLIYRVTTSFDRGEQKALVVAPTGIGKTAVKLSVLAHLLRKSTSGLYIVVADTIALVDQLRENIEGLRKEGLEFSLLIWADNKHATSFSEIYRDHKDEPTILVTTDDSLIPRLDEAEVARKMLKGLFIDEAHHAGAKGAKNAIELLIDHPESDAKLYGTTATPFHGEVDILSLFGNQIFWYGGKKDIVEQLDEAIDHGELTSREITTIGPFHYTTNGGGTATLTEAYYEDVAKELAPLLERHTMGFISVGTQKEAEKLAAFLNEYFKNREVNRVFASYHAETKFPGALLKAFYAGEINFIVTPKMFDEGRDIPKAPFYADLNQTIGPRTLMQRQGRVLRLAEGKRQAEIAIQPQEELRDILISLLKRTRNSKTRADLQRLEAEEKEATRIIRHLSDLFPDMEKHVKRRTAKEIEKKIREFYPDELPLWNKAKRTGIYRAFSRKAQSYLFDWQTPIDQKMASYEFKRFVSWIHTEDPQERVPSAEHSLPEKELRSALRTFVQLNADILSRELPSQFVSLLWQDTEFEEILIGKGLTKPVYARTKPILVDISNELLIPEGEVDISELARHTNKEIIHNRYGYVTIISVIPDLKQLVVRVGNKIETIHCKPGDRILLNPPDRKDTQKRIKRIEAYFDLKRLRIALARAALEQRQTDLFTLFEEALSNHKDIDVALIEIDVQYEKTGEDLVRSGAISLLGTSLPSEARKEQVSFATPKDIEDYVIYRALRFGRQAFILGAHNGDITSFEDYYPEGSRESNEFSDLMVGMKNRTIPVDTTNLGKLINPFIEPLFDQLLDIDVIVPFPSSSDVELPTYMAKYIAEQFGISIHQHALTRSLGSQQKEQRTLVARYRNIVSCLQPLNTNDLKEKRVLLIDDNVDSGASLRVGVFMLMNAGAASVKPLALGRLVRETDDALNESADVLDAITKEMAKTQKTEPKPKAQEKTISEEERKFVEEFLKKEGNRERIDKVIQWMKDYVNIKGLYVFPSNDSKDPEERKLGDLLNKNLGPDQTGLSCSAKALFYRHFLPEHMKAHIELSSKLRRQLEISGYLYGLSQAQRIVRSPEDEFIERFRLNENNLKEITAVIDWMEQHLNAKDQYIFPSDHSKDPEEKGLGNWLNNNLGPTQTGLMFSAKALFYRHFLPNHMKASELIEISNQLRKELERSGDYQNLAQGREIAKTSEDEFIEGFRLNEKNLKIIQKIIDWMEKHLNAKGQYVLPSHHSKDPEEVRVGQLLAYNLGPARTGLVFSSKALFYRHFLPDHMKAPGILQLSDKLRKELERSGVFSDLSQIQEISESPEAEFIIQFHLNEKNLMMIQKIIDWMEKHRNTKEHYMFPSSTSKDQEERKLGQLIFSSLSPSRTGLLTSSTALFYRYFLPDHMKTQTELSPKLRHELIRSGDLQETPAEDRSGGKDTDCVLFD